jgi:hypothetical protein
MKKIAKFTAVALFYIGCLDNPTHANAREAAPSPDGVIIIPYGSLFSEFATTVISPKTTEDQSDFSVDAEHGILDLRIDESMVGELARFLNKQNKSNWSGCHLTTASSEPIAFRIGWSAGNQTGVFCVAPNEAITIFRELNKFAASTSNQKFSSLTSEILDSLKQISK